MKEKMLRAAREKVRVTDKGKPIRLTADLSAETLQARRQWGPTFNVLKEKNFQPRISYPAKLSFISEGKIKFFANKQVLRDYITTRPALQEVLKEALHMDGNNQYQPFQKHSKRAIKEAITKNEFMSFAGTWMKLETIILSKLTQEQKTKHLMFSLITLLHFGRPRWADHKVRSLRTAWPIWQKPISTKNAKISWAWWQVPVVPATQKVEAGESLQPWRQKLQLEGASFCYLASPSTHSDFRENLRPSLGTVTSQPCGHIIQAVLTLQPLATMASSRLWASMSMRGRLSGGLGQLGVGLQEPLGTNSLGALGTVDGRLMAAGDRQAPGQKGAGTWGNPTLKPGKVLSLGAWLQVLKTKLGTYGAFLGPPMVAHEPNSITSMHLKPIKTLNSAMLGQTRV
ncbi:LINE-1 retrotransposable element ORF1 protein [Plecturocebus cupreus]